MKPEDFSPLGMYGLKEVFERRLMLGYREVALGSGEWVDDEKVTSIWAFYHPDGQIGIYGHPKLDDGEHTVRGNPFEAQYTKEEFKQYCKRKRIQMSDKTDLAVLMEKWNAKFHWN